MKKNDYKKFLEQSSSRQIAFQNILSRRVLKHLLWIGPAAMVVISILFFATTGERNPKPVLLSSAGSLMDAPLSLQNTVSPAAAEILRMGALPPRPAYQESVKAKLRKGDNLFDLLIREGIASTEIHELVTAARRVHNLSRMQQNQTFSLDYDNRNGQILRFETDIDSDHYLIVEHDGEKLHARKEAYEFEIEYEVVSGTINESLFLAAHEVGLPPVLILELAEVFAWDIDFHVDMRRGDTFQVLYEKKCLDGRFAHLGRILAAVIVNRDEPFWAFYFVGKSGNPDYYDNEGRSLRKAFLKSPLKYRRISSGFSFRRLHPILKIYRPHLGIDYAAPTGTPVRTIGDGRIKYAGWKSGFGRYIEVRHNDTYTSTYGHLHRFAKGIKKSKYVEQGKVIGYVGSTGLSTGPHLDFRLLKNGRFINPLKVNIPDADPVKEEDMPDFKKRVEELLAEIERSRLPEKLTGSMPHGNTS